MFNETSETRKMIPNDSKRNLHKEIQSAKKKNKDKHNNLKLLKGNYFKNFKLSLHAYTSYNYNYLF